MLDINNRPRCNFHPTVILKIKNKTGFFAKAPDQYYLTEKNSYNFDLKHFWGTAERAL